MITQEELDRDVSAIEAKIARAEANKTSFLIAIDKERGNQVELGNLIHEEERRARTGKRPTYDVVALRVERCSR